MRTIKTFVFPLSWITLWFLAGCAVSPDVQERRQAIDAEIDAILSQPAPAELGDTKRCLSDMEFRSFRAIDDRHILFSGSRDRLWVNTLRTRCPDLRFGDVLVVKQFSGSRMCDADHFYATDWFDWPSYRRWPWSWGSSWTNGMQCTLGKFQPVTADQVAEIEAVLKQP